MLIEKTWRLYLKSGCLPPWIFIYCLSFYEQDRSTFSTLFFPFLFRWQKWKVQGAIKHLIFTWVGFFVVGDYCKLTWGRWSVAVFVFWSVRLVKPSKDQWLPNPSSLSSSPLVGLKRRSEARKVHLKDLSIRQPPTPADSDDVDRMSSLKDVCSGLPLDPLPPNQGRDPSVPHAPVRAPNLTAEEERVSEAHSCF